MAEISQVVVYVYVIAWLVVVYGINNTGIDISKLSKIPRYQPIQQGLTSVKDGNRSYFPILSIVLSQSSPK